LHSLSESVGRRLRKKNLKGNTIRLKLRWQDFTTLTRQSTLANLTDNDLEIYTAVKDLFKKTWKKGEPVRLLGVGVTQFSQPVKQLSLWDAPNKNDVNLITAVDVLRDRYGKNTIMRGSDLKYKKAKKSDKSSS
jgi:benzoyl-CoA reductase/2-hydroxyglutaryl-CoA dehydratase subunit BcrC/BadD/HgdB